VEMGPRGDKVHIFHILNFAALPPTYNARCVHVNVVYPPPKLVPLGLVSYVPGAVLCVAAVTGGPLSPLLGGPVRTCAVFRRECHGQHLVS